MQSSDSSVSSDDTSVSFEDGFLPPSQRITRTQARLRRKEDRPSKMSSKDKAGTSSKSKGVKKAGKEMNVNNEEVVHLPEVEDMEVEVKKSEGRNKMSSRQLSSRQGVEIEDSDENSDISHTNEENGSIGRSKMSSHGSKRDRLNVIKVKRGPVLSSRERNKEDRVDVFTTSYLDLPGRKTDRNASSLAGPSRTGLKRNLSESSSSTSSSLSSVNSLPELVNDSEEALDKKSRKASKKGSRGTARKFLKALISGDDRSRRERSSSVESFLDKGQLHLLRKPKVLVPKLSLQGIQKKVGTPPPLAEGNPTICVTQAEDEAGYEDVPFVKESTPLTSSPVAHRRRREGLEHLSEIPERLLRSGKSRLATEIHETPESSKTVKTEKTDAENDSKRNHEKSVRKSEGKKEKLKLERSSSNSSLSSGNGHVEIDIETVVSPCPTSPKQTKGLPTAERPTKTSTPQAKSLVKKVGKRQLNESVMSSDSDFNQTPSRKKRKKLVMKRCSSEDEERPEVSVNSLTVRLNRKTASSTQVSSEEPEAENSLVHMNWESWEEEKKKKLLEHGTVKSEKKDRKPSESAVDAGDDNNVDQHHSNEADDGIAMELSPSPQEVVKSKDEAIRKESTSSLGKKSSSSRGGSPEVPIQMSAVKSRSNTPEGSVEYTVSVREVKHDEEEGKKDFPAVINCIACGRSIQWASQQVFNHPRLAVIICQVTWFR